MTPKLRPALAVLGIALVVFMSLPLYERFFGRKRLRFPYLARAIPAARYDALAAEPGWSKAEVEVGEGLKLRGLVRAPSEKRKPWLLFYPGNDESQLERGQGFLRRVGGALDLGLAVFAYRGYDASDGKSELAGIRADAPLILQRLCEQQGIKPSQVHLAGFSIGGHFSVHAARGAAERGQRAATLTLLAPVDDIVMYQPSRFEKLSAGDDYRTTPYLGGVPAPVLVLQGSADQTLDGATQGRAIAQGLGERAKYVELAGVGHVPLLENEPALQAMRDFLKDHPPSE
jgi:pimeloyl-ACP methyl ester carboxylesterase